MQTEIASTVRKLNRLHISCVPFGEKELLDKGAQGAPFHLEDIFESLALRLVLAAIPWVHDIASEMVEFITSKFGKQIFRICVGESDRFPELGREFYDSGPMLIRSKLIDFFEKGVARGDLKIDDFELAADQFHELAKATLFPKLVFNIADDFSTVEKERVINGAVEMFMARYGA